MESIIDQVVGKKAKIPRIKISYSLHQELTLIKMRYRCKTYEDALNVWRKRKL